MLRTHIPKVVAQEIYRKSFLLVSVENLDSPNRTSRWLVWATDDAFVLWLRWQEPNLCNCADGGWGGSARPPDHRRP